MGCEIKTLKQYFAAVWALNHTQAFTIQAFRAANPWPAARLGRRIKRIFFNKEGFFMRHDIIHILGASGSGTTTLGRAISERFGHMQLDTDDYFWIPTDPPYAKKRDGSERRRLMKEHIRLYKRCVISGSLCGWGDFLIPRFDLVIRLEVPAEARLERLEKREYARFGDRIRPGGDMWDEHREFMAWSKTYDTAGTDTRSRALHDEWLKLVKCPIMIIDGTAPLAETMGMLANQFGG